MQLSRKITLSLWAIEALGLTLNVAGATMTTVSFQASSSSMQIISMPHSVVDRRAGYEGKIVELCANSHILIKSDRGEMALGAAGKCDEDSGAHAVSVVTSDYPTLARWGSIITVLGFFTQALACLGALLEIVLQYRRENTQNP